MKKLLFSLFLIASLTPHFANAVFSNAGIMRSKNSTISADVFDNTGTLEGLNSVHLECDKLVGNGLIKGPKIEIIALICAFNGVIECDEECTLTTNTPESELKFKFKGSGKLIIKKIHESK